MTHAAPVSPVDRAGLRQRIDKALTEFLAGQRGWLTAVDDGLLPVAEAIEAFVLGGGKRLRPAFGYWGYRGAGGSTPTRSSPPWRRWSSCRPALIHDDLMDRSDTRRGEPAMHRRFAARHRTAGWGGDADSFGDAAAILLGDLCLVWSDELLHSSGLPPATVARARPVFDEMRTEVTVGQYLDVLTQATGDTSLDRAAKVARYKSAKYTVERPLLLGAALAGAPPEVHAAYSAYGLPLGEAFQLRDDVLGVFGDPERTGKPAGDDLREGKRTYLVAAALETLDPAGREALLAGLGVPDLDAAGVDRLRELITTSGALDRAERHIAALTESALAALTAVDLDTEARQALVDLAIAATRRPA
ncbi:polyprenyl synthetase family protein [Micromonospora sp. BRA006-A]|nr:polyprenyl synthetase family protein [Micromonospora sp. BRA006-A]